MTSNSIEEISSNINDEEKKEYNFYDMCIEAIELNNDNMINKEECIKRINQLKANSLNIKNRDINNKSNITNKKNLKGSPSKKSFKLKNIDEILEELENKNINLMNKLNLDNKNNSSSENIINEINNSSNIEKGKREDKSKDKIKVNERNLNKFFKGKQKRYSVLKHINEYLESNDVTINELIENNPFQDKPYDKSGSYEFIEAVKFGNYDYVNEALIKHNHFLFVIDYFGQTGYHWAAKLGNIKMLNILINFGRHHNQKDFKGRTPLYLAAVNNNKEVCKFLLDNGANPFLVDKNGKTPADAADNRELSEFLKESMAQPFSNPVYKAKVQKILQDREIHMFKDGDEDKNGSNKKLGKVIEQLGQEGKKNKKMDL
jgi:ankyrin repeat protein